jgi:hypothetical protein
LERGKHQVDADDDVEDSKRHVLVEVLAAILALELRLALRDAIEQSVSGDWDVPKDEDVRTDQDDPVHDEFALLLRSNLGL